MMRRAWNAGHRTAAGAAAAAVVLAVVATVSAAAFAETGRSVLVVLDASGSMNQPMPEGRTRLEAAKAAVEDFLGMLPADIRVGLRVYGHRSSSNRKNCEDSELVARFAPAGEAKVAIIGKLAEIRAHGYTPITRSLQLAARDIGGEPVSERAVVLVSDGHETCKADPCAAAKALAAADAKLVIHTIGLGVADAARRQLQCIASVAGGAYFDARSQAELAAIFAKAAAAKKSEVVVKVVGAKTGILALPSLKRGGAALSHAETGKAMDFIGGPWPERELAVGIYNVTLANGIWTGIQVKPGETTVLQPALLRIENGSSDNMQLLDPETSEQLGYFNMLTTPEVALVPGYVVPRVGKLSWPAIEAMPGKTTVLRLGMLRVNDPSHARKLQFYVVKPLGGGPEEAFQADKRVNLPPGKYLLWNISTPSERMEIEVADGQTLEVRIQRR
jgi:Ca-activated chloride channel family protein